MLILWCNTSHKKTATKHIYHKSYLLIINVSNGEYQ